MLFLQGGATLQFSMVPLNLLTEGRTADYVMTGSWAEKAVKEARRVGTVHETRLDGGHNYNRIPRHAELELTPGAAYVHMTSNNTIEGTEWHRLPQVRRRAAGERRLVGHLQPARSTSRGTACIYAGAQKNLGPAGVTVVIIREDLLERSAQVAAHDAELHRPRRERLALQHAARLRGVRPRAGPQVAGGQGGLEAIGAVNERKADTLYGELDRTGFWRPTARRPTAGA